jgi:hypothetical protein
MKRRGDVAASSAICHISSCPLWKHHFMFDEFLHPPAVCVIQESVGVLSRYSTRSMRVARETIWPQVCGLCELAFAEVCLIERCLQLKNQDLQPAQTRNASCQHGATPPSDKNTSPHNEIGPLTRHVSFCQV